MRVWCAAYILDPEEKVPAKVLPEQVRCNRRQHPVLYTLHPTPYTLYTTPYTLPPEPRILTLPLTPYTLHPTPCTPKPCALHATP